MTVRAWTVLLTLLPPCLQQQQRTSIKAEEASLVKCWRARDAVSLHEQGQGGGKNWKR